MPLIGYVVMPEHVHLLMGEPPRGDPSKVLQVLKKKFREPYSARIAFGSTVILGCAFERLALEQFWSYYEKGENGLIAIEFAGADRNERAGLAGGVSLNTLRSTAHWYRNKSKKAAKDAASHLLPKSPDPSVL